MDFAWAQVGQFEAPGGIRDVLLGSKRPMTRIPLLAIMNCELVNCRTTTENAAMANGHARDATVDIPVPERIWRMEVPPGVAAPPPDQ